MSRKLTKRQKERRDRKRALKAQRQRNHEKRTQDKWLKRYVVRGEGPRVVPKKPRKGKQKQRRNGQYFRVGGR